jgi:hypothetical protein
VNISNIIKQVKQQISSIELANGEILFNNNDCTLLSQSSVAVDFMMADANESALVALTV